LVEVKMKIILPGEEGKEAGRKKTMELLPPRTCLRKRDRVGSWTGKRDAWALP
jgi:hypothetical protein